MILLLLAAACASPTASVTEDEAVPAAAAVRAFANICGRLDAAEIARRAGNLGFRAVDAAHTPALQGRVPTDGSVLLMARPPAVPGSVGALLAWNARGPSCELAVAGVAPAALEQEFGRMVQTLAGSGRIQVRPVPLPANTPQEANGLRIRSIVVMAPTQADGTPPQVVLLRTGPTDAPDGRIRAVMSLHVARPVPGGAPGSPGAIPPPAAALATPG